MFDLIRKILKIIFGLIDRKKDYIQEKFETEKVDNFIEQTAELKIEIDKNKEERKNEKIELPSSNTDNFFND